MTVNLMLGDCLERMKEIPDHSVDFILTDPPYGTTACKWDSVIPFAPMWEQIWRVLKPNGACALFGSEPFSSHLRMSQIKFFKYDWVWEKNYASGALTAKFMPMKNHEIISIFYKEKPKYFPQKIKRTDEELKRLSKKSLCSTDKITYVGKQSPQYQVREKLGYKNPFTVIKFKTVFNRSKEKVDHPTQKPVGLLEYLIKTYTLENETVLDFTMGSGSTGVACQNLGRNFIGIEKDEKYFEIAEKRIKEVKDGFNLQLRPRACRTLDSDAAKW
jgi:site-specific DNA-methyltransferase (adenine-specific)